MHTSLEVCSGLALQQLPDSGKWSIELHTAQPTAQLLPPSSHEVTVSLCVGPVTHRTFQHAQRNTIPLLGTAEHQSPAQITLILWEEIMAPCFHAGTRPQLQSPAGIWK